MDESHNTLPELGTRAAAVAAIESLIYTALHAPGTLEPERLRYWLDAYYQARRAQEIEEQVDGRDVQSGAPQTVASDEPRKDGDGKKAKRHMPVGWTDGFEPGESKKAPAAEAAALKREQFERLQRLLREGVTMQRIIKAAEGSITEDQILGIRECRRVPVAVYRVLQAAMDRIETE